MTLAVNGETYTGDHENQAKCSEASTQTRIEIDSGADQCESHNSCDGIELKSGIAPNPHPQGYGVGDDAGVDDEASGEGSASCLGKAVGHWIRRSEHIEHVSRL